MSSSHLVRLLGKAADEVHDLALVVAHHYRNVSQMSSHVASVHDILRLTCTPVHPIHNYRSLEGVLARLELLQRICRASGIRDDAACFRGTQVLQDIAKLIAGRRTLLDLYSRNVSPKIPIAIMVCMILPSPCSRTKIEVRPLELALLRVVCRLVLSRMCMGGRRGLLQQGVYAHRRRAGRLVEEGDDIFAGCLRAM